MAEVRCVDGRRLDVVPVPVLDRTGAVYETTLRLLLDGAPFGEVGERCSGALRVLVDRLAQDPVVGAAERTVRERVGDDAWAALRPHLPRDAELFCLRARDPDDVASAGELRALLQHARTWDDGRWTARCEVVLQAWGDAGTGVKAVLDVEGLRALLGGLLAEADALADEGRRAGQADGPA